MELASNGKERTVLIEICELGREQGIWKTSVSFVTPGGLDCFAQSEWGPEIDDFYKESGSLFRKDRWLLVL